MRLLLSTVGFLVAVMLVVSMPVVADLDPLYNDSNVTHPDNTSWMEGNDKADIDGITTLVSRIGSFIIGSDASEPTAGPYMTGLVVGGIVVVSVGTSRVGIVGGGMAVILTAGVVARAPGVGPQWLYAVIMLLVGLVAGILYNRYNQ